MGWPSLISVITDNKYGDPSAGFSEILWSFKWPWSSCVAPWNPVSEILWCYNAIRWVSVFDSNSWGVTYSVRHADVRLEWMWVDAVLIRPVSRPFILASNLRLCYELGTFVYHEALSSPTSSPQLSHMPIVVDTPLTARILGCEMWDGPVRIIGWILRNDLQLTENL